MFLKNKKLDKEISQHNIKLDNLNKNKNKVFNQANEDFEIFDTNKEILKLKSKRYENFTFIPEVIEDIEKKINTTPKNNVKKIIIKEIKTSIPSDWLSYRSQIEFSKQPFLQI